MRSYRLMVAFLLALSVQGAGDEYLVAGTAVWVHATSSSIAIRGSSLLGRLHVGVKSYQVKQPSAPLSLQPGDSVTAVFSRKDGLLHRVRRVRSAATATH